VEFGGIDDLRGRQLAFNFLDAPFDKTLLVLADSYSAFSLRSPWARASAMALMTAGRSNALS
jgi:hypothetical protein